MSDEGPPDDINSSVGAADQKFVLNLLKQNQNFAKVWIIMVIIAVYLIMKKICKPKADNRNVNFPTQILLAVHSLQKFTKSTKFVEP